MILIFFFNTELQPKIDSLKNLIKESPKLKFVLELNRLFLRAEKFDSALALLEEYEKDCKPDDKPSLIYHIGENLLFAGRIPKAQERYLETVARFSRSDIANDALERLYLLELGRKDTIALKRLGRAICNFETQNLDIAKDSFKALLNTGVGDYAYYYLSLLFCANDELTQALGALAELNSKFPAHQIHNAVLLAAEINLKLGNKETAQRILTELLVNRPNSIYAVRARRILKELPP